MSKWMKFCAALIAAAATLTPIGWAQDLSFAAKVNVPFPFEIASGQHFQPGDYVVTTTGLGTMLIRSARASGMAMIQIEASQGQPIEQGKAVFMHYGDSYFLRSVDLPGTSTRLIFGRSKEERQSEHASVRNPGFVALALLATAR